MTDRHLDMRAEPTATILERCRTAASGTLRETREAWPALGFYERFEQVVCLVLTFLIACLIAVATWYLVIHIVELLLLDVVDPANQAVFQTVFGMVMTVLIALLALVRKFIIIDATKTEPMTLIGLALAALALGGVYWLVREQDHREARDQVGQT
jgi:uncharacterized membrane protein (DUF373 family)